ncbi:MAG: trigger factor [Elusimicrobia bacterium]|nr:trigger factor [Elusimicrobiota bacterium]MBU2614898.1 trigger factor [Elusimicrobiota bacterium]
MENLKTTVKDLSAVKIQIDFEIPKEKIISETELAFQNIQKVAKVDGFRQGKAPMTMVKQKFEAAAKERIAENIIRDTLYPALKEKNINPATNPVIEKIDFNFEKPMTYSVTVEKHPEVTARNYKGLKFKKETKKVTENDINKSLEELQKYNTRLVENTSGITKKDSCVMVDYTVWMESAELKEMKAENQMIDLTHKNLLPGLAEGLTNSKTDDYREITTILPENFAKKELANKEVVFKVTVKGIKDKQLPELTDDFAKEFGNTSLAELKTKIKDELEKEVKKLAEEKLEEEIVKSLIESNPMEIPESVMHEHAHYLGDVATQKLKYQGFTPDLIEKQKESIHQKTHEEAQRQIKLMYILGSIAKQEKIEVKDEDLKLKKDELVKSNPGKESQLEKYFTDEREKLISQIKTDKIFKFIIENSKIKEVAVDK